MDTGDLCTETRSDVIMGIAAFVSTVTFEDMGGIAGHPDFWPVGRFRFGKAAGNIQLQGIILGIVVSSGKCGVHAA